MSDYQTKVLRSSEEIDQIRNIWKDLEWHPNADFDFFKLILAQRPEILRPYVILVLKEGKPVSLLAGRVEDSAFEIKIGYKTLCRPRVRRITIICGGFMGDESKPVARIIVGRLLQSLGEENADLLSWHGVQWDSPARMLLKSIPGFLCKDYLNEVNEHWKMRLPDSVAALLDEKMNKKHRYWARRTLRMLEKDFPNAVQRVCFKTPAEVTRLFNDVVRVASKTYHWGLGGGFQDNNESLRRLQLAAEKGWLRGFVLYIRDEPKAFWLCTVYKQTVHLDFTGYDPDLRKYELGTALFLHAIDALGKEGVEHLDFGLGTAFYKERFGDDCVQQTTPSVFAMKPRSILLNGLNLMIRGSENCVRSCLAGLGLEQKLKRVWRTCLTPLTRRGEGSVGNP
jgi:hypothetical protein